MRLAGIGFGLPFVYTFDEPTSIGEAIGLVHGATDALSFANPPLYKYLLVALFTGMVGPQRLTEIDPGALYLIARTASAALGASSVVLVYRLAGLLRGQRAGLVAAGLASITYPLVREAHFGVNDALAALCTTAALVGCVQVACHGARRDYVLAGVGLGLAFAAKYQAAAVLVPLVLAHAQLGHGRRTRELLVALGVALITAVLAFPPLVTETRRVIADVYVFLMLPSRLGFEGLDPAGAYVYYLKTFGWGIGWPMFGAACVTIARAVARREWPLLVVASLPVCLYVVMGSSHMYVARFLLPGVSAIVALTAVLVVDVGRRGVWLAAILGFLLVAGTLPSTLRFDILLARVDTRSEARAWVQTNVPAGARVAADAPPLGPTLDDLQLTLVHPPAQALYDLSLEAYRAEGVEYVVTSSFAAEAPNLDPARDARRRQFYTSLQQQARQLAEFSPVVGSAPGFVYDRVYGPFDSLDRFRQPGPAIRVYQLTAGGAAEVASANAWSFSSTTLPR